MQTPFQGGVSFFKGIKEKAPEWMESGGLNTNTLSGWKFLSLRGMKEKTSPLKDEVFIEKACFKLPKKKELHPERVFALFTLTSH
ncbi:hypothetical protein GFS24_09740 [Chitinophaga sp. SYP-B3965]|uniref:hypothetical protein n=1 Tax=Chitinophaga sp. SYP-B3965 TaxID=2663120 RepID=UPI001299F511|nr:hypothetical protein [Chitinophaga sp. SYP-B3965]MRG45398.1 hypothetical protein [Chitinophaga sp. SYP-B3965]